MTDGPVVHTSTGAVRGTASDGHDRFLGIPYAAPPFGDRRFLPPQPASAWNGVRDAAQFGPTAPQAPYRPATAVYLPTVEIPGDDILTANVWTPSERTDDGGLPVLVFVHGGALTRGAAALGAYDGATFVRHGIVFVSVQYRLGQEGFAVLDDVAPNLGVLDVQAALRWVRAEIGAFGGDPANVTVMGHSAGANVLSALLALGHAAELFDRAILQSGPLSGRPPAKAGVVSREVARRLGVEATRAGFSSKDPADLVAAQSAVMEKGSPLRGPSVSLAIGGDGVPVDPLDALTAGASRGIPVLIGSTSEEYRLWMVPTGEVARITRLTLGVARLLSRVPRRVVRAHRRRRPDASPGEVLGEVVGDMLLRGPITRFADSRVGSPAGTWVYEFRWRSPVDGLGAAHGMELGFVFDTVDGEDALRLNGPGAPQRLADAMHTAWTSFVLDGEPGWEPWSARRPVQAFDAEGGHLDYAPRRDELDGLPER